MCIYITEMSISKKHRIGKFIIRVGQSGIYKHIFCGLYSREHHTSVNCQRACVKFIMYILFAVRL